MAIVILVVACLVLFVPSTMLWIETSWINYLLMIIMFCMGLTLKLSDFKTVFMRPKEVLIGSLAQFIVMPGAAYALAKGFEAPPELFAGVILVGACPGGTASNVVTYLSRGDLALSVAMTSVNTLLAPILTPAITFLLLRTTIQVDVAAMFISIAEVVLAPIALGILVNKFWRRWVEKIVGATPYLSIAAIALIVAAVVSHNAEKIRETGVIVFAIVVLHNAFGYLAGLTLGLILKLGPAKTKALSVEIGMQNSGLATGLAQHVFATAPLAAVPGAIFSVWHNISGAILAEFYKRWENGKSEGTIETAQT